MENNISETAFVVKEGGAVCCKNCGDRVKIARTAVLYSITEIKVY